VANEQQELEQFEDFYRRQILKNLRIDDGRHGLARELATAGSVRDVVRTLSPCRDSRTEG
jgi:hypothetical protein